MKQVTLSLVLLICSLGFCQDEIESSLFITDTTTYNGDTIYVFNDKSWEYSKDYSVEYTIKTVLDQSGCIVFDSTELFTKNWNTNKTFSNQYNLYGIRDSILIDISGFHKPVAGSLTSGFKFRWGKWHKGNDLGCSVGTKVVAAWPGVVRYAKYNEGGYGNLIIIRHYNGLETYYAHLNAIQVVPGQKIDGGMLIGYSGNTGASKGPHLHFEVRLLDNAFDPGLIKGDRLLIHKELFGYLGFASKSIALNEILKISPAANKEIIVKKQTSNRGARRTAGNM